MPSGYIYYKCIIITLEFIKWLPNFHVRYNGITKKSNNCKRYRIVRFKMFRKLLETRHHLTRIEKPCILNEREQPSCSVISVV